MNAEQASKKSMRRPTRRCNGEGCQRPGSERRAHRSAPPGYWRQHACKRGTEATREAPSVVRTRQTGNPRGPAWAGRGGGEARSTEEAGSCRGMGRGLSSRGTQARGQGPWRLAKTYKLRIRCGDSGRRYMRKRRETRVSGSTRSATRSGEQTCSPLHGRRSAAMAEPAEWTARRSSRARSGA